MALPKVHRLRRRQDFSRVYQAGLRRHTPHLTLRALRQPRGRAEGDLETTREPVQTCIGISIGLKVSKRAVVRNRIKRRIRSAMQELLPHLTLGWLIVIVVKPSAIECTYEQFLQELEQLLVSAEVIINEH
ncbi:MAG: ribonuclease P protein component [Leptolyngbyaceae cyanobacterium CSU_1_4]|nr:ribonuclease P protein component [Leptolyngbyaceae cyanobacterium CSU_1_4]